LSALAESGFNAGSMYLLANWLVVHDKFLGVEWGWWKMVGWLGNVVFFSRFFVQWWATERHKRVVVPDAFWWLSLAGSLCLLLYSLHQKDSVFIFAYVFTWIPYIRSLIISHRVSRSISFCPNCNFAYPPHARFCPQCGLKATVGT
jgi:lipid-A-disaccharide synthase-like uncharacterized protein